MRPITLYFFLFGFCASLLLPSFWEHFNLGPICFFVVLIASIVFLLFLRAKRFHQETVLFWAVFVFLLGFLLATIRLELLFTKYEKQKEVLSSFVGKEVLLRGVVRDRPKETEKAKRFSLQIVSVEGKVLAEKPTILVITDLLSRVSRGEEVSFSGEIIYPESFLEGGELVDWPKIISREGIFYEVIFPKDIVTIKDTTSYLSKLYSLYDYGVLSLATLLPLPERSLGQGILLGKNFSQSDLLTSFRKAGLSHIVVLSGYNVVIIVRGFLSLAPFFGRRKVIFFSVVGILVFLFSIGPEPPLLRAVIMTLTLVLGEVVGRPGIGSRPFYFTLFILLLFNPLLLSSNVSFQLSFLATAGILYLEPLIKQYSNKKEGFILSIVSTTLAAELAVLPLIIVTFSTFSPYFLLANILVLPVIPIVMLLGVLAVLLSSISFFLASVLAWPLYGLLKYVLFVAHGVSRLPGASLSLPDIPIISLVFFYILFFYFLIYQDEFSKNPFIAP